MILIIGGGPAGRLGAMRLARAGRDVLLVERKKIGGQCLHHGCMMVCALNDVARVIRSCEELQDLGIMRGSPELSFPVLLREMGKAQYRIEQVLEEETRQAGVEILYGKEGRCSGSALSIDGERVSADAGIIATGSRPNVPPIPGISTRGVFTPHTLPAMEKLPQRMVIMGGGVMAAEFAYIFSAFGSEVTILCRSGFLRTLDPYLRDLAQKELPGVTIREQVEVEQVDRTGSSLILTCLEGEESITLESEALLIAAGLVPNGECAEGVKKGPEGEIVVDDHLRTSAPGIYACGDVTGPPYFTPVARMEGIVAADNILGRDRVMDYQFIPQAIALRHDIAFCGSLRGHVATVTAPGPAGPGSFWSVPTAATGSCRVAIDPETGSLAGVALAVPGGALIATYLAAMLHQGTRVQDLERLIEVHPSTDGVLPLLRYLAEWRERQKG